MQVFTREGIKKDDRALEIERNELAKAKQDLNDELRIREDDIFQRIEKLLLNRQAEGGPAKLKKGTRLTKAYLVSVPREKWFDITLKDATASKQLEVASKQIKNLRQEFEKAFEAKRNKITQSDDLAPGVLKIAKVYLAVKRRVQPGDKMAGRHGNKGVIFNHRSHRRHALYGRWYAGRYRLEPLGCTFSYEHRTSLRNPLGLGC